MICETTAQAEDAVPNGTAIRHVKGRLGKITGSQWVEGRLWYHAAWDDGRSMPWIMSAARFTVVPKN